MSKLLVPLTRAIALILLFSVGFLNAQNKSDFFRSVPSDYEIELAPQWAQEMYSANPDVFAVVSAYEAYYKSEPFEKTIHTQNFKAWVRSVESLLNKDGFIVQKSKEEKDAEILQKQIKKIDSQLKTSSNAWTSIGPFQTYESGSLTKSHNHANVYSLDQSLVNPNILICGTESGGVFISSDKGLTWNHTGRDAPFTSRNSAVACHPTSTSTFIIASYEELYRTIDGGATWNAIYFLDGTANEIKFDPTDANHIFVTSSSGLFESFDGGNNWTQKFTEDCWDLDYHPTTPGLIYLLKSNSSAKKTEFYRSSNNGVSWNLVSNGWYTPEVLTEAGEAGGKIAVSADDPNRVYACLIGDSKAGDNGWIGIYRSDDAGLNWYLPAGQIGGPYQAINTMPWTAASYSSGYHQGFYNFDFEASPNDADLLWAGTIRLIESADGGFTYSSIGGANSTRLSRIHSDIQSIHCMGNDVWVTTDGGISYSNDDLQSHDLRNYGIVAQTFWGFGAGWNEDVLVGGKYHNGNTAYHESYGLGNSKNVGGVEEATGYVNPQKNRTTYFGYNNNTTVRDIPIALADPTITGTSLPFRPNEHYFSSWSSGLYHHPWYSDKIYAGREGEIGLSEDGGSTWSTLHDFGTGRVLEMEINRNKPDFIYALFQPGTYSGGDVFLQRSENGGQTWVQTSNIPSNDLNKFQLCTNPQDENEVWVASLNGDNNNKVFRSLDGGQSWTNFTTSSLSGEDIRDIHYHAGSNGLVYLLTTNNFFYYDPSSSTWVLYDTDMPAAARNLAMDLFYRDQKIRVAGGRGFWEVDMPQSFSPIAQMITETDIVPCLNDTVHFDSFSFVDQAATSWSWSFSPTPAYVSNANTRNPDVVFGSGGYYSVTLSLTDSQGQTSQQVKNDFVFVADACTVDPVPGNSMETILVNDHAITEPFNISSGTNYTLTAWLKPADIQDIYTGIIFNDGDDKFGINFRNNNMLGYHWPGGSWFWDSGHILPIGKWSHVALVSDPTGITIYLDGIASKHDVSISAVTLNEFRMGSYRGWDSRNYRGEIDEVCVWNRSLSETEIRNHRHLTKENLVNDPNFLAYYQFNESGGDILNKVGLEKANLTGNAARIISSGPFGGGTSAVQNVNNYGNYSFGTTGVSIDFLAGGTLPNGDVYVSRIDNLPYPQPSNPELLDSYFVVNNYGNGNVSAPLQISFDDPGSSPTANGLTNPFYLSPFNRTANGHEDTWTAPCSVLEVNGEEYLSDPLAACNYPDLGQFFFSECLSPDCIPTRGNLGFIGQTLLAGPYETSNGLMRADLNTLGLIPNQEPYTALGFNFLNNSGGASLGSNALLFTGNDAIVDWVFLELRDENNPSIVVATTTALIQRDGGLVSEEGIGVPTFKNLAFGNYHLGVHHRNHLSVYTGIPYNFAHDNLPVIDFINPNTPLHNPGSMHTIGASRVMWAGDGNQDGKIIYQGSGSDILPITQTVFSDPLNSNFQTSFPSLGYGVGDYNLDGSTIYQGAGSDILKVTQSVFLNPLNTSFQLTFPVLSVQP